MASATAGATIALEGSNVNPVEAMVSMIALGREFDLHMKMLDYLHGLYPKIHISLHAGELAMGLVPPEGLRFHIRESVARFRPALICRPSPCYVCT